MKKTSKILSITFTILMVLSMLSISSSAISSTSGSCGDNLTWTFDDSTGVLTISGEGDMYDYPYNASPWFHLNIKSVIIEDGVATVGDYAFYWQIFITNVTIADSVTKIGNSAFVSCESLVNVSIGSGLETIGEGAFGGCINLISIIIPDGVTYIGANAFYDCTNLVTAVIGSGVTTVYEYTFGQCYQLKIISLPDSLTTISKNAFYSCSKLKNIYYSGTIEQWWDISIDDNNGTISHLFFYNFNAEYPSVEFASGICGENLTWTFDNSTGTLSILGTGAMDNYDDLINPPWQNYKAAIKRVVINNSVTSIGSCAFCNCYNLTNITIPDSITFVGIEAFSNCYSLSSIVFPDNITRIDDGVFNNCYSLMNITVPDELTSFGSDSLSNCKNINNIYYCGTEEEWEEIVFEGEYSQHPLKYATIHYNYHIHKYNSVVTAPTCVEQGYTTYTCECGDGYVGDYVDVLGHIEETVPAVAPTCTETGLTAGAKCSVCGETLTEQKELSANGHTPANAVEENYIAPTCTENGSKDVVVYCSVCNEEISRETVILEATDHADNDGDGYCDTDNELLDTSVECDHICHKAGILGFVWRIINVFNMLFGLNNICECGVLHY